jgi:hypothetical protein
MVRFGRITVEDFGQQFGAATFGRWTFNMPIAVRG